MTFHADHNTGSEEVAQSGSQVANAVRRECECCGRRWVIPCLLLLIPVGAAVYFWAKKNDMERRLNNLGEPKKRSRKSRRDQQARHAKLFKGETETDESHEDLFENTRFSDEPPLEAQETDDYHYIRPISAQRPHDRSRAPSPSRQKQPRTPQTHKTRGETDQKGESSGRSDNVTERAIAYLSRTVKYTNLKVIELQESICCLDQQVKDMSCELEVLKEAFRLRATNAGMM